MKPLLLVMFTLASFGVADAQQQSVRTRAGAAEPRLVVSMYADLSDPVASRTAVMVRALVERRAEDVAVEFHHHPANGEVGDADRAVVAATGQGRGWEMLELLLANQNRHTLADARAMAAQLQLDAAQFDTAFGSDAAAQVVAADVAEAERLKLPGGVALVVGGETVVPTTLEALQKRVEAHLAR